MTVARKILFSGHVQGVGFRYTTYEIAGRFPINGYVKNLPDGRVELVTQGEANEIDHFVDELTAAMKRNIINVEIVEVAVNNTVKGFSIRY